MALQKQSSDKNSQSLPPQKHDPYLAMRQRNYRLYLLGAIFTMIGVRIQGIAIAWEVYQRTDKAFALGLTALMQGLPTMILALPAGYLADAFNRRKVVMLSLLGATLTSLALAALSFTKSPVVFMYLVLFMDAAIMALGRPARVALLPQIVPREVFPNAVTWSSSIRQLISVFGPAIGGFVLIWNIPAAYVICAAGSLSYIALLAKVEIREVPKPSERVSIRTLLAGIHFVTQERLILALMALDMFAVLLGGAVYLLPIFARDILQIGERGFGVLRSAPAAGAFCMALLLVYLPPMKRSGRNLLLAVAGFGAVTIIFGFSKSFWLSLAMLFLTGLFDNVSMVIRHTLIQLLTPDEMRGRVSAVNSVFIGASNQLGGFESGTVAHWFGPVFSVVSGGTGTIVVVLLTALISRRLRTFGKMHEAKPSSDK